MSTRASKRVLFAASLFLFCAAWACASQTPEPPLVLIDPRAIDTYVAQTAQSALTLSAVAPSIQTFTPGLPPTSTLFSSPTFTPTFAATFTPAAPVVSVSTATNCRSGPGKVYDYEGALMVGETAEIFGVDPTGRYLYVRNPDNPKGYCWVWTEYASVSGSIAFLPVYTPPPTPTPTHTPTLTPTPSAPDFQVAYAGMDSCGDWRLEFKLANVGMFTLRSVQIEVTDNNVNKTVTLLTDGFTDVDGCARSNTRDALSPGTSTLVSSAGFAFDPTGHDLTAKITACVKIGLGGGCRTRKVKFVP